MASLLPLLQDILPMLRPVKVQVIKSTALQEGPGQTDGIIRKAAVVGLSDHVCASVITAKPHTFSAIHHHGEQDTIIYAASGYGTIVTNPYLSSHDTSANPSDNPGLKAQPLSPGDFAFIPAWTEHQEVNSSDEDMCWILTWSGSVPVVVNLAGWGGREI